MEYSISLPLLATLRRHFRSRGSNCGRDYGAFGPHNYNLGTIPEMGPSLNLLVREAKILSVHRPTGLASETEALLSGHPK